MKRLTAFLLLLSIALISGAQDLNRPPDIAGTYLTATADPPVIVADFIPAVEIGTAVVLPSGAIQLTQYNSLETLPRTGTLRITKVHNEAQCADNQIAELYRQSRLTYTFMPTDVYRSRSYQYRPPNPYKTLAMHQAWRH